ncbi:polysaccharide pyruvyl transferase family protein [Paracoccus sp. MBLB3053]|uniref:Polysaccharide pyruvyl transferase family protein n=1 Tax=Paracoccus aurantius TaxID=3073814 RepID=A0ABU2HV40_9RHOB|nr:polysaccharide pyruvyl transferase family protein [Paracoccus sp. MBLB3053]MDS9468139.1 polysaccharide pyruvyl transferase family protein [Paracoccus sp. MBLB3053]
MSLNSLAFSEVPPRETGRVGFVGISSRGREGSRENTGNYLHGFAARQILGDYQNLSVDRLLNHPVDELREKLSHVAFVAATTIKVNDQAQTFADGHTRLATAIEKLGLPVIVFGLGAQARLGQAVATAEVSEETRRLLAVLSHHSSKIAVRGEFTADLCRHLGIDNVEVIGCQSCFLSCRPDFRMPELEEHPDPRRMIINITRHSQELPLLRWAMANGATMIGQSSHFEYALARTEEVATFSALPDHVRSLATKGLQNVFNSGSLDFGEFHTWVKQGFSQFYSMPPWFDKLATGFHASIGTRFHGNMTAMQAGLPSLWVVHDSRTREFCDHLGLPNVPLELIQKEFSMGELFERFYETRTFRRKYPSNYRRFYDYLQGQSVPHRLAPPLPSSTALD